MSSSIDPISALIDKIAATLGQSDLKADVRQKLRAVLQSRFAELGMVSREEFDAQVAVLARTRQTLERLEQELADLQATAKD